jgi:hypothetical protein
MLSIGQSKAIQPVHISFALAYETCMQITIAHECLSDVERFISEGPESANSQERRFGAFSLCELPHAQPRLIQGRRHQSDYIYLPNRPGPRIDRSSLHECELRDTSGDFVIPSSVMAKPTNEMERLGLLAAIPGIELAIAALQEQLQQMKEDAGISSKVASTNHILAPKETSASNADTKEEPVATRTRKQDKGTKSTEDGRDPDWKEKLSQTLKAKWAAMSPRERAAKSRALAAARAKKQALKKKLAA